MHSSLLAEVRYCSSSKNRVFERRFMVAGSKIFMQTITVGLSLVTHYRAGLNSVKWVMEWVEIRLMGL